ncbi:MAG: hypothetical protein HQ538_07010 [Parcubacteria group bacterium]|nr:hypothetical protein [Parcubacteria group bacterium]
MKYFYKTLGLFAALFFVLSLFFNINIAEATLGECCNPSESACDSGEKCQNGSSVEARGDCEEESGEGFTGACIPQEAETMCSIAFWNCESGEICANVGARRSTQYCMPEGWTMPTGSDDSNRSTGNSTGNSGGGIDYDDWRQRQLDTANSVERGVFTEGLSSNCMAFGKCTTCDILMVTGNIFRLVFEIVGIVAVAVITMGGFFYVTSGGSEEAIASAKKTIVAAVLGTLIVFAAWVIINTILNLTGFNIEGGTWWNPSC